MAPKSSIRHLVICVFGTPAVLLGCAKPITTEFYSRSPTAKSEYQAPTPSDQLIIGVGVDSPSLAATVRSASEGRVPSAAPIDGKQLVAAAKADASLRLQAQEFIAYARQKHCFKSIEEVTPENLEKVDLQLELSFAFDEDGDSNVHYCLGRLVANIYNSDHSVLLYRPVRFYEAMYTPSKNRRDLAHDGVEVRATVRRGLFDELIQVLSAASPG